MSRKPGAIHTDWKSTRDKFQEQRYSTANRLIPFVRESAQKLLGKLMTDEGKPDHNLLAAILPLPATDAAPQQPFTGKELVDRKKELGKTPGVNPPYLPVSSPRCWKLRQSAGEIRLSGNPAGFISTEGYILQLRAAYDLRGRNPFKAHSKFDFDLHKATMKGVDEKSGFKVLKNSSVTILNGNDHSLLIHVTAPDFEITFLPADLKRDLIIKVGSKAFDEPSDEDEGEEE